MPLVYSSNLFFVLNFIAHLYLSGEDEGLLLGNFIADAVKGKDFSAYPDAIAKGIVLHRKIDDFSDHHPVFKHTKQLLVPNYNHYAGVLVDIFYDYFLALHWKKFTDETIEQFSARCMASIERQWKYVPEHMRMFYDYVRTNNRIVGYNQLETITKVLNGMSRRTDFKSGMEHAVKDLRIHYNEIEQDFLAFFPEIQKFVSTQV